MPCNKHFVSWTLPELDEDGVRIALTIVDTPGFGDNIDNEFAYVSFSHLDAMMLTRLYQSVSRRS